MAIVAVAIISAANTPVFLKTKYDFDEKTMYSEEKINLLYILHSSLDNVEEKQNQQEIRDPYLGLLHQCEDYKVYGLLSATRVKVLLMISTNASAMLRDTEARVMLKQIHSTYIDVTVNNTFYKPGEEIQSRRLESVVKNVFST